VDGEKKDKGLWCIPCGKIVLVGGTYANIQKHYTSSAHNEKVKLAAAHHDVAQMLLTPVPVNPSSEDARLNARAVFALSAVRLMPKSSISAAFGRDTMALATRLAKHVTMAFVLGLHGSVLRSHRTLHTRSF
jgi:hypothetical protein